MPEELKTTPAPVLPNRDPRVLPPQTKFKTGDRVRSVTGSPDMILGTVLPEHTMNDQVECYWTQPAVEATDKTPTTPEVNHAILFFLGQLALLQ